MSRQRVTRRQFRKLGGTARGGLVRGRLLPMAVVVGGVWWLASQDTTAGKVTRGILAWFVDAAAELVTFMHTLLG